MLSLVNASRVLMDWIVPQSCLLCGEGSDQALCSSCTRELPWLKEACERCALPLAAPGTCAQCLEKSPSFDSCHSVYSFTDPVGPLINQFKRRRNYRNGKILSAALADTIADHYQQQDLPGCLVPVPLHWRRLVWRGFNQSTFLAQEIGSKLQLPINPILRRNIATSKQQGLDRKHRLKNLKNAFLPKNLPSVPSTVALVDDVMTTGATAEAASAALKRAGVQRVDVWVLARTPLPR